MREKRVGKREREREGENENEKKQGIITLWDQFKGP